MDASDFSRLAESIAEFIESRSRLSVGPVHCPPIASKKHITFITVAILIWTPFFLKKLIDGNTVLQDKNIWMAGAIFVSGAMFNIIRKMPMFLLDKNDLSKLAFQLAVMAMWK
ncbi:unnamed protein product [Fraxinus pennsylvanica]|uniref:Uncharacterized protein n=1 Tax=Fraxinus pennsylvanica TaxID=56036 RepID=A0AAD2DLH6_9LAMI|nr:unnamed protein product [Fraxinus pennsylvanica]